MLLDKVRENLGFKYFNSNDLNLIFKSKSFPLKKPLQNKIFPEIKLGDFVIKLANKKSELKKAQALRYSVFYKEKKAKPTFPINTIDICVIFQIENIDEKYKNKFLN